MTLFVSRGLRLAALSGWALAFQPNLASGQTAAAQTRSLLSAVKMTVPAGEVVHVTDTRGRTLTGVLGSVTSDLVEVILEGETRAVVAGDVKRIRWQQKDSWLTGAMIGAGIGAIPGIYYLINDPNECAGMCPEEYALVGIGALVGALVDKAITRKVTVYEQGAKGGAGGTVSLTAALTKTRRGVQFTVRF